MDPKGEIFTQAEREYSRAQPSPYEHLATKFCAKEAVAKALVMDGFEPLDIEMIEGGEVVDLARHGDVEAVAHAHRLEVSISLSHIRWHGRGSGSGAPGGVAREAVEST